MSELSHFDDSGQASMVDVSAKQQTRRTATASAFVELSAAVLAALPDNPKGNPLEVARFAGIQAAKRTSELIPMCRRWLSKAACASRRLLQLSAPQALKWKRLPLPQLLR